MIYRYFFVILISEKSFFLVCGLCWFVFVLFVIGVILVEIKVRIWVVLYLESIEREGGFIG